MLLACDIGNTNFKFALFDNERLVRLIKVSAHKFTRAILEGLTFNDAAISSVIPDRTIELRRIFLDEYRCRPFIINQQVRFNLNIEYSTPLTLGIDRICSMEGALSLFRNHPLFPNYSKDIYILSVDSGTATTINIVEYDKRFIGGMIMPGLETMFSSLNKNTAQLPRVTAEAVSGLIGKNTESSIASGVLNSTLGLIDRTYEYLKGEGAEDIIIYITGGNGDILSKHIRYPVIYSEDLVLQGIKAIYERNKSE